MTNAIFSLQFHFRRLCSCRRCNFTQKSLCITNADISIHMSKPKTDQLIPLFSKHHISTLCYFLLEHVYKYAFAVIVLSNKKVTFKILNNVLLCSGTSSIVTSTHCESQPEAVISSGMASILNIYSIYRDILFYF